MTIQVLFVCVHNAGRSQMAEAFFNDLAQARGIDARAESGGTQPAEAVHPEVVAAMREAGIDLAGRRPALMTNQQVEEAGRVITMGCQVDADACPAIFLKDVEDWGLPDPKGRPMDEVRAIRDEIRRRVEGLLDEMGRAREG